MKLSHFNCILWFPVSVLIVSVVGTGGKVEKGLDAHYCADEAILAGVKTFLEQPWIEGMMQTAFKTWGVNVHVIWEHLIRLEDIASSKEAETLRFFCANPISRWSRALDFNTETKKGPTLELFVQTFAALKLSAFIGHPDLCEGVNRCCRDMPERLTVSTHSFLEMEDTAKKLLTPLSGQSTPKPKHSKMLKKSLQIQNIPEGGLPNLEESDTSPSPGKDKDTLLKAALDKLEKDQKNTDLRLNKLEGYCRKGFPPARPDPAFMNDATLAEAVRVPLSEEIEKYKVDYIAGGAKKNYLRTVQWILKRQIPTTVMGGVGTGKNSEEGAGAVAVHLTGNDGNTCAFQTAASILKKGVLEKRASNGMLIEKAEFYFVSEFFLTGSPESTLQIVQVATHAATINKIFALKLSAPFISQFFKDRLDSVLPFIDILFGNGTELKAFSKVYGFGLTDETEIAKKIVSLPKVNKQRSRMVIITQGQGPVIVGQESGVQTFPVPILAQEKIVDTNGAGDAFVGGFLAQHVQGKGLAECVKCGIWTATEIIQQPGCTFPKDREYK